MQILNCYKKNEDNTVIITRVKRALYPENITLEQSLVSYTNRLILIPPVLPREIKKEEYEIKSDYDINKITKLLSDTDRLSSMYRSTEKGLINLEWLLHSVIYVYVIMIRIILYLLRLINIRIVINIVASQKKEYISVSIVIK